MEKIQAHLVIEILGKPKENVSEAMTNLVNKLATEKGVAIIEKTIHEPVPVKDTRELFTTFTELLVEFDSVSTYLLISFAYLPSNIEIISPEKVTITNNDLAYLGNKIMQRVHEYDAVVKNVLMERDMLTRKLYEVAPHLFKKKDKEENLEDKAEEKKEESTEQKEDKSSKKKSKKKG